jgi:hypothetical protein
MRFRHADYPISYELSDAQGVILPVDPRERSSCTARLAKNSESEVLHDHGSQSEQNLRRQLNMLRCMLRELDGTGPVRECRDVGVRNLLFVRVKGKHQIIVDCQNIFLDGVACICCCWLCICNVVVGCSFEEYTTIFVLRDCTWIRKII